MFHCISPCASFNYLKFYEEKKRDDKVAYILFVEGETLKRGAACPLHIILLSDKLKGKRWREYAKIVPTIIIIIILKESPHKSNTIHPTLMRIKQLLEMGVRFSVFRFENKKRL